MRVCKTEKGTSKCQLLGSVRSCVNTCFLRRKNSATVIRSLEIKYLQSSPLLLFNWEKNSNLQEHARALLIRLWCLHVMCLGCFSTSLKHFAPKLWDQLSFIMPYSHFFTESRTYSLWLWAREVEHEKGPSPAVSHGGLYPNILQADITIFS